MADHAGQSVIEYVLLLAIVLVMTISSAQLFQRFHDESLPRAFCQAVHAITGNGDSCD